MVNVECKWNVVNSVIAVIIIIIICILVVILIYYRVNNKIFGSQKRQACEHECTDSVLALM